MVMVLPYFEFLAYHLLSSSPDDIVHSLIAGRWSYPCSIHGRMDSSGGRGSQREKLESPHEYHLCLESRKK